MITKFPFIVILISVCSFIAKSNGDRVKDSMYIQVNSSIVCYRRMNATHQIGCSSERGGSVGIIHYCDTLVDLDFFLKNGTAGRYIPVVSTSLFSLEVMTNLINNKHKIAGLILHPFGTHPSHFSHENQCPNEKFNVEGTCGQNKWNPWGTGLLYKDIPFPMFFIEDENEIDKIRQCFQSYNNYSFGTQSDRSLCSLELSAFMYATTDTPTCRRRSNIVTNLNPVKLCDPLGDRNVWGSLFPLVEEHENSTTVPIKDFKYVILAARMDTTSLFDKTTGAESPVTGTIALLSVAKLLKQMLPARSTNVKTNVLFILFNGETYDYIGSQRLLFDMERGEFPTDLPLNNDILPRIYPKNITLFIELSQLAQGKATYAHYLGSDLAVTSFINTLQNNNPSLKPTPNSLPPSSLHTFLKGQSPLRGLVITNHEKEYQNHYYNSLYDNTTNIGYQYYNGSAIHDNKIQKYIADVATMVAKSLYELVTKENYTGNEVLDLNLVDEMFHCYLEDFNCTLHRAIQKGHFPKQPVSLYVGVNIVDNFFTSLVSLTMAWFTGDKIAPSGPNCTNLHKNHVYKFYNMSESLDNLDVLWCYRATVNMTEAVSPAFIIQDYDWSSNTYSSWSESAWTDIGVRMFLKPSPSHERMTLALGSVVMILSFIVIYFIHKRSHVLFDNPAAENSPVNC